MGSTLGNDGIAQNNARFARAAIARFVAGGCAGFVISPGSRHTPLVLAVAHSGMPLEVVLDERAAGFVALGWAKAACAPIALICTSGTAGANYLPAVVEAWETGVPLILVTTDRPPEHLGIGAPQTTRQDGFYTNHLKRQCQVGAADDPGATDDLDELTELVRKSASGKPGPVQLNIGIREPLWEPSATPSEHETPSRPDPQTDGVPEDLLSIPDAVRGLLIVGPVQEARPDAEEAIAALVGLARRRGWPILADIASGLRQDGSESPALVHGYDLFLRSAATREALRPELVLHAGRMPTSKTLFTWLQALEDDDTDVLHLSTDGQPHSLGRAPRILRTSWAQLTASCKAAGAATRSPGSWQQHWQQAQDAALALVEAQLDDAGLWEGAVARAAAHMPAGSTLVLGSGMPIRDADTYVHHLTPGTRCLVNRGVNGIDGQLATAAGAAKHDADSLVRLVVGDQGFLYDVGSLAAVAAQPNLDIVVINNGGSGIFEFLPISQAGEAFETFFLAPQQTDILKAAEAFGIRARHCASVDELAQCLDEPHEGSRVVEVMVDRRHNVYIHKVISDAVIAGVDREFHVETSDGE